MTLRFRQRRLQRLASWMQAVREAFIALMPLTFLGIVALLAQQFPWGRDLSQTLGLSPTAWFNGAGHMVAATHGIFGMALAVLVAVNLAGRWARVSPQLARTPTAYVGISALCNFMLFALSEHFRDVGTSKMAVLMGIAVGIGSAELFRLLLRVRCLRLANMPSDTEASFHHAFRLTPVIMASGSLMFLGAQLADGMPALSQFALTPFVAWSQSHFHSAVWILSSTATALYHGVWFCGVAGGGALDTLGAELFSYAVLPYTSAFANRALFNHFVLLGGAGATWGLILAILLSIRGGPQRRIAWWSTATATFNVNELVLYGLPVVLNPRYWLPFLGVPLVLNVVAVAAVESGWITLNHQPLPWTTPALVSGWLLTDSWRGVALQLVEIGLATALYLPFARRAETERLAHEAQSIQQALCEVVEPPRPRLDQALEVSQSGLIARTLLRDLRADLLADAGAVSLAYQPKHDASGRLIGAEALVRWTHARHGAISPAAMIALVERSNHIQLLGTWVLQQACACKARLNAHGLGHLTLSVNVSPLQLSDETLPDKLLRALRRQGLHPREIELEITETATLPEEQVSNHVLDRIVHTGVGLAMDDFGMGYSSLLYMRRLPIHAIKIDGSLTRNVLDNPTNADIIRSIGALGRAKGVDVVAEYVETTAQLQHLAELGCNVFQGYLFSPPLHEAAFVAYCDACTEPAPVSTTPSAPQPVVACG